MAKKMALDVTQNFVLTRQENDPTLKELIEDIREHGLINPIIVTPQKQLVSGERRLLAYRALLAESDSGSVYQKIPALQVACLEEALPLMEKEGSEYQSSRTLREKLLLGALLEEFERPLAAARRAAGRRKGNAVRRGKESVSTTRKRSHDVKHWVGSVIGISGPVYLHATRVVEAAARHDAGLVEKTALEEMYRTEKINGPYALLQGTRPLNGETSRHSFSSAKEQSTILERACTQLSGIIIGLTQLGDELHPDISSEDRERFKESLWRVRRTLEKTIRKL